MKALITGATGGIGLALIEEFIKIGYDVIAVGRNTTILESLKKKYDEKITTYSVNFVVESEIDKFLKEIEGEEIEVLINGAGIGQIGYLEELDYQVLKEMIEINILALTKLTKYFYGKMLARKNGTIVNISSTAGFQIGGPLMGVYYGTKAYVNSFTMSTLEESRGKNIRVVLLAPGPTQTNFVGMKKKLSTFEKLYVTAPELVAKELVKGIRKGSSIVIPGKINKILYFLDKFIPVKFKLKSIMKIQAKKIKK